MQPPAPDVSDQNYFIAQAIIDDKNFVAGTTYMFGYNIAELPSSTVYLRYKRDQLRTVGDVIDVMKQAHLITRYTREETTRIMAPRLDADRRKIKEQIDKERGFTDDTLDPTLKKYISEDMARVSK